MFLYYFVFRAKNLGECLLILISKNIIFYREKWLQNLEISGFFRIFAALSSIFEPEMMRMSSPKVVVESHINVPLELLQTVRLDRLQWSLAALSAALKSYSPSSCYILRSVHQFCAAFHMGYDKAMKLLDVILSD